MDLLDIARRLEQTPLKDTCDGSTSWFDMHHEEGLAVDRWGRVVQHMVAGQDKLRMVFDARATKAARDGGLMMHSHPVPGTTFSVEDLIPLVVMPTGRGMLMVVTTSHPLVGVMRRVRYILDSRESRYTLITASRVEVEARWDRELIDIGKILIDEDDGTLSIAEGNALHMHRIMDRLCKFYGIAYRREILE